ncbi:MAG: tetrameric acyl-CoA thioesterase [Legionella sp. 40-6]|nr:YiiD C-terminal domain-containing protein [Legionella sp.]OJY42438.1 MAG: tetrameric acyl-CoA thioesterase [Legionella sp. 40-6]
MKFSTLLKLMRFWPPFLGAGIRVKSFKPDYTEIVVQMKLYFWNRNYVGTHFGGSIYSMTDPYYMLMLMNLLGRDYIIWDKAANIRYKKPARGTIYATFSLSLDQIEALRQQVLLEKKIQPEFIIPITNKKGEVVAEVVKVLSISQKEYSKPNSG